MLTSNTWYMMSAVINGTTHTETIYVNGANVISNTLNIASTANALDIGFGGGGSSSQYLYGGASNIQVYSTALTQPQIQQLYQQGISSTPLLNAKVLSWFPLDGDTNDYSTPNPHNRTAAVAANIVFYSLNSNLPYWTPSISGYGAYFNGASSQINILSSPPTVSRFTVAGWLNLNSMTSREDIMEYGDVYFNVQSGSLCAWVVSVSSSYLCSKAGTISTSNPVFASATWNGLAFDVYINGVLSANSLLSGTPTEFTNSQSIGFCGPCGGGDYFNGTIADVQVYRSALSSSQISQLYNAGLPISQSVTVPLGGVS
jgi:hypothetical protein